MAWVGAGGGGAVAAGGRGSVAGSSSFASKTARLHQKVGVSSREHINDALL
jgi:hypothetical protein